MHFGSLKVREKCLNSVLRVCYEPWLYNRVTNICQVGGSRSSDDEKRVAIQKLAFCPSSGKLLVGGAGGHVTLFTFESESGERQVETSVMDFTACQEGLVWNGPEALTVKSELKWSKASYQPLSVCVANPPAACTALAVCHSEL